MPPASAGRFALAALLLGAVALGTSPLFVRVAETGPTATGFWRMVLSLPLLWALMRATKAPPLQWRQSPVFFWPGLAFAMDLFFWQWAIHYTTMASATLLSNFAPVIVTAGAWLFLRERIRPLFVLALAIALAGAALLMGANAGGGERFIWGDMMGLASAVFYGAYMLFVARLRGRYDTATLTFWYSAWCAAISLPIAIAMGDRLLPVSAEGWLMLLGLAAISHVLGQGLIAYGFGHLPASFSSIVVLVQPLVAAILGWMLLGEAQGPGQIAGGVAVLIGIIVARRATLARA